MIGILIGVVLFLITLPLKSMQLMLATSGTVKNLHERLRLSNSDEDQSGGSLNKVANATAKTIRTTAKAVKDTTKAVKNTSKVAKATFKVANTTIKLTIRALRALITLLRAIAVAIASLGVVGIIVAVIILLMIVAATAGGIILANNGVVSSGSVSSSLVATDGSLSPTGSDIEKVSKKSAKTKEIIKMNDEETWKLITEGKFKSYDEVNAYCKAHKSEAESFFSGLLVTVEVPCWKWDKSKGKKIKSTCKISVNKYLKDYFTDFMTDLYNLDEKYCIVDIGGYCFRTKNNDSADSNYSAHSFGAVLDINSTVGGMGSVPAKIGDGIPYKTTKNLKEPHKSQVCAFNESWFKLAMDYKLDWGGNWSAGSLDPMHFSLVGDNKRAGRNFKPKTSGQS